MGTVLRFSATDRRPPRAPSRVQGPCEIVIFPGVRIERHGLDLGHRIRDTAGHGDFNGLGGGGKRRPRRSS
jgi:hypothetical protein